MANPIENWLYKGATNPRSYYANMPLWDALKMDIGEGWSSKYTGPGKSSWPKYMYEGIKSLTPWGRNVGNIAGGTTGSRALYERGARFLPWMARTAMSAPVAGLTTFFQSTPANAGEDKRMEIINQQWANQQNQNNENQGGGQTRGPVGMGSAPIRSAPTGPNLRNRANGGIISLWQR